MSPLPWKRTTEYFRYYFLGAIAMIMYNACRGIMQRGGRQPAARSTTLFYPSVLNVGLDVRLCRRVQDGAFGRLRRWRPVICAVCQASFLCCRQAARLPRQEYTAFPCSKIRLHTGTMLRRIVRYGLPSGPQNSVIGYRERRRADADINWFGKMRRPRAAAPHAKIEGFAFLPITSFTMATDDLRRPEPRRAESSTAPKRARASASSPAASIAAEVIRRS